MMWVSKGSMLIAKASLHMTPGFLLLKNSPWQSIFFGGGVVVLTAYPTEHSDIHGTKKYIKMNHTLLSAGDCH